MKMTLKIISLCTATALLSACSEVNQKPTGAGNSASEAAFGTSSLPNSSSSDLPNVSSSSSDLPNSSSSSSNLPNSSSDLPSSSSSSSIPSSSVTLQSSSESSKSSSASSSFSINVSSENENPPDAEENTNVISENITVNSGDEIRIEKDEVLRIDGDIELLGDIYVEGKLIVSENAEISGTGVIHIVNSFDDIDCRGTVSAKIDAPDPIEKDGVTYVGGILVVNKKYSLPKNYGNGFSTQLNAAVSAMRKDSGFSMKIASGFRSYALQESVFAYWCSVDGVETASTYSARPGHSEHQSGLAADITSCSSSYANTPEAKWLAENCYKYGVIIRYPKDKSDITGYIYEPWHIRYLGKSTAKLVHDSGLCLEEFLEIDG